MLYKALREKYKYPGHSQEHCNETVAQQKNTFIQMDYKNADYTHCLAHCFSKYGLKKSYTIENQKNSQGKAVCLIGEPLIMIWMSSLLLQA